MIRFRHMGWHMFHDPDSEKGTINKGWDYFDWLICQISITQTRDSPRKKAVKRKAGSERLGARGRSLRKMPSEMNWTPMGGKEKRSWFGGLRDWVSFSDPVIKSNEETRIDWPEEGRKMPDFYGGWLRRPDPVMLSLLSEEEADWLGPSLGVDDLITPGEGAGMGRGTEIKDAECEINEWNERIQKGIYGGEVKPQDNIHHLIERKLCNLKCRRSLLLGGYYRARAKPPRSKTTHPNKIWDI